MKISLSVFDVCRVVKYFAWVLDDFEWQLRLFVAEQKVNTKELVLWENIVVWL